VEHIYKSIAGFVYAFQRTHFELQQLLVQLDGRAPRYAQEAPSPVEFKAEVAEAQAVLAALQLSQHGREAFDALSGGLDEVVQLYQRLTLADFKLPEREIASATEACRKTQQLLRQCGQIAAGRKV
jgi:hypothetical protein